MTSEPRRLLTRIKSEVKALEDELARAESGPGSTEALMEYLEQARSILRHIEAIRANHSLRRSWIVDQVGARVRDDGVDDARPTRRRAPKKKPVARAGNAHPKMQKRELVAFALDKLGCPSPPATISTVIKHLFDVEVPPSQFSSMRKGDERAWHKGIRDKPLIVPALNAFDLSARPRTVALSEWPLETRIMGSLSDRADALRTILTAKSFWLRERNEVWRELMVIFARDFRFAPPVSEGTDEEADRISVLARKALDQIWSLDHTERQTAAERAERLSPEWQMFGRPVGLDVIQGGKDG